jgi:hypothetical protein
MSSESTSSASCRAVSGTSSIGTLADERARRGAEFGVARGEQPAPRRLRGDVAQQFQARFVRKVQVVEDEAVDAGAVAVDRRRDSVEQARALAFACGRARRAEFGQQRRQFGPQRRGLRVKRGARPMAQQARDRRIDDVAVARPSADDQRGTSRLGEVGDEARLAHAGFAVHESRMAGVPRRMQRGPGLVAADQARRALHRGRHARGPGGRRRVGRCRAVDRRQQCQRFGRRPRTDLVFEHLLAAVEREQRRRAVARQVVQAHHAAVRVFGQRFEGQQFVRVGQRVVPVFRAFGHVGQLDERTPHAVAPARALGAEPLRELARRKVFTGGFAEQGVGILEVMRDAPGQGQRRAALDQVRAQGLAQLEQALAQRVARRIGVLVGPQQLRQARARRRSLEREPGQQRSVERRQWVLRAAGHRQAGVARQVQLHAQSICVARRSRPDDDAQVVDRP